MAFLRCRPFAFWLVFVLAGGGFLLTSALLGGPEVPTAAPRSTKPVELMVMMPDVLSSARAGDGSVVTQARAVVSTARAQADRLERLGSERAAAAYREVARFAATLEQPQEPRDAVWRAEVLSRAVSALGVGSLDPLPAEAWQGPPAPATTTTVPSAGERVARMDSQLSGQLATAGHP